MSLAINWTAELDDCLIRLDDRSCSLSNRMTKALYIDSDPVKLFYA